MLTKQYFEYVSLLCSKQTDRQWGVWGHQKGYKGKWRQRFDVRERKRSRVAGVLLRSTETDVLMTHREERFDKGWLDWIAKKKCRWKPSTWLEPEWSICYIVGKLIQDIQGSGVYNVNSWILKVHLAVRVHTYLVSDLSQMPMHNGSQWFELLYRRKQYRIRLHPMTIILTGP